MTEKIKNVIEELTRDCTPEEKAKVLQIVGPREPGKRKPRVKMDYTSEEFEHIRPILDGILAAISEEKRELEGVLPSDPEKENPQEEKNKAEQFKKQLEEANIFREKHYKYGLELYKLRVLLEIAQEQEAWEAITNSFDYGYMVGYKAAQRNARKKAKANQEGEKRA